MVRNVLYRVNAAGHVASAAHRNRLPNRDSYSQRQLSDLCEEFALDRHVLHLASLGLDAQFIRL